MAKATEGDPWRQLSLPGLRAPSRPQSIPSLTPSFIKKMLGGSERSLSTIVEPAFLSDGPPLQDGSAEYEALEAKAKASTSITTRHKEDKK